MLYLHETQLNLTEHQDKLFKSYWLKAIQTSTSYWWTWEENSLSFRRYFLSTNSECHTIR